MTLEAGSRRYDVDDSVHIGLGDNYPEVCNIQTGGKYGSGVLISENWVLTAAHVVAGESFATIEFNDRSGDVYISQSDDIFVHDSYNWDDPIPTKSAFDVALLRLDRAVEGVVPARLFDSGSSEVDRLVNIAGWGLKGDGINGKEAGTGLFHCRAGPNMIDLFGDNLFGWGLSRNVLLVDFDSPGTIQIVNRFGSSDPLDYEFLPLNGDSGGPWYVNEPGGRQVVAVSSFLQDGIGLDLPIQIFILFLAKGTYGDIAGGCRVAPHLSWMNEVILGESAVDGLVASDGVYEDYVRIELESVNFAEEYEVYRSRVDDITTASFVSKTSELFYEDVVPGDGVYFFWVRPLGEGGVGQFGASDSGRVAGSGAIQGNLSLQIVPQSIPLDGSSLVTLTVSVHDQSGNPVEGADVTFTQGYNNNGGWTDSAGNYLSQPDDGPTDAQGRRVAYHKPAQLGTNTFTVSIPGDSATGSYTAVGDSGGSVVLSVALMSRSNGEAWYDLDASFRQSNGDPISDGTARFTTNFGDFGVGAQTNEKEIRTYGSASTALRVTGNGTGTVAVEYVEGGISTSKVVAFSVDEAPVIDSHYSLPNPSGAQAKTLAVTPDVLTATFHGRGMWAWDPFTFSEKYQVLISDFGGSQNDWAFAEFSGVSNDGQKLVVGLKENLGIFNGLTGDPVHRTNSFSRSLRYDLDVHPNGPQWASGWEDAGISVFNMSGVLINDLDSFEEGGVYGVAYSPDGTRLAYTREDSRESPSVGDLVIYNTSNWTHLKTLRLSSGSSPWAVAWSPDSQMVAATSGEESVQLYSRNGETSTSTVSSIPLINQGISLSWSPDGSLIAVHIKNSQNASVFRAADGLELFRLNGSEGEQDFSDSIKWRSDGKVLFQIGDNSTNILTFSPFDVTEPEINLTTDPDGTTVTSDSVTLSGRVTDDIGLIPNSAEISVNGGAWQKIELEGDGSFSRSISLTLGTNLIALRVTDLNGNEATRRISVTYAVQYQLLTSATNGSISKDPNQSVFYSGDAVELTAVPEEGYEFSGWSGDVPPGFEGANPLTVSMTQNRSVSAQFFRKTYSLSYFATNGSVSVDPEKTSYQHGESVQLTASPEVGYEFDRWTVTVQVSEPKK